MSYGAPSPTAVNAVLAPGYTPPSAAAVDAVLSRVGPDYGAPSSTAVDAVLTPGYTPPSATAVNAVLVRSDSVDPPSPSLVLSIGGSTTTAVGASIVWTTALCVGGATLTATGGAAASSVPAISSALWPPHIDAQRTHASTIAPWYEAARQAQDICAPLLDAARIAAEIIALASIVERKDAPLILITEPIDYRSSSLATGYDEAERRDITRVLMTSTVQQRATATQTGYHEAERRDITRVFSASNAQRVDRSLIDRWGFGLARTVDLRIPWGQNQWAPWLVVPPVPTPPTPTLPANGRYVGINLGCPVQLDAAHLPLLLGSVQCYHTYPRQRTYHVLNSASIVRLPDRTPIAASAVNLSIDADSFSWSVSIDLLDAAGLELLMPTVAGPREVEITINGWVWTALIDSDDETAAWLGNSRRVAGRSRAAYLADPYAPVRSRVVTDIRLAQQLADLELASTGWSLDWECLDWLVPAGAWTYTDLTPVESIRRIAATIGAIVQTHRTDDVLSVRAQYPVKPWDWDSYAPDHIVLPDYTVSLSGTYAGGTRPNAVVTRGERYGIAARVIRAGTAGDIYAGSVVDALITTAAAAQDRAIYEMSRVGPIRQVSVEMPLFPSGTGPGLIEPGRVVLMSGPDEYRSVSRGCSISAQRTGAQLRVRQTITVERHLDYA